jgi:hypothetical protein
MAEFQIFIVFHKHIFDECYQNIPGDMLYKYFTFIAVNPSIKKYYTPDKYKIVNEWELPIYDKSFQDRGYNENSAIYHVHANQLHTPYKYIGFFQYDMKFRDDIVSFLQKNITPVPTLYSFNRYNFNFCSYETWNEPKTREYIIHDYEQFYQKPFTKDKQYPLFNSYIIPVETYEKVMAWVSQLYSKLYPWTMEPPNATHFGHIGGIYERIMGYAIGEEDLRYVEVRVDHDNNFKMLNNFLG